MSREDAHRIREELLRITEQIRQVQDFLAGASMQQKSLLYSHLRDLAEQLQDMGTLVSRVGLMTDAMSRKN